MAKKSTNNVAVVSSPESNTAECLMDEIDFAYEESIAKDISESEFFGFPMEAILRSESQLHNPKRKTVAYFSMEFGLAPSFYNTPTSKNPLSPLNKKHDFTVFSNMRSMDYFHTVKLDCLVDLPIYSGGLGVLAGDSLKSAADHKLPLFGVGILWNKGYFLQRTSYHFGQEPVEFIWEPRNYPGLVPLKKEIEMFIGREPIILRLWKYYVFSHDRNHVIPLVLMDSDVEENTPLMRRLTDQLYYSKSDWWKIVQRKILGAGGIRAIRAMGYEVDMYHLNEGHAALAFVEATRDVPQDKWAGLKKHFAYTCHTPVEAGHDRLPIKELKYVLSKRELEICRKFGLSRSNPAMINLTLLALNTSHKANAVSEKHKEVTRIQFPSHTEKIQGITNGIHHLTWVSETFADLFDRYKKVLGNWRDKPECLKNVMKLCSDDKFKTELWEAHQTNKRQFVKWLSPWLLKEDVLTIAWARRAASYKRPELVLYDLDRLVEIAGGNGSLQIIFAGKAHPADQAGADSIRHILEKIDSLSGKQDDIKIIFLEDYDTHVGKLLTSGVDVWLNNPLPPFEASGTSGMKAILNGVLQLSTRDGWVAEVDKDIGIIFGYEPKEGDIGSENNFRIREDAYSLYNSLEKMTLLYKEAIAGGESLIRSSWVDMMMHCIAEAAFFNTNRMVTDYNQSIWKLTPSE
jgi:starch phosphorylase